MNKPLMNLLFRVFQDSSTAAFRSQESPHSIITNVNRIKNIFNLASNLRPTNFQLIY